MGYEGSGLPVPGDCEGDGLGDGLRWHGIQPDQPGSAAGRQTAALRSASSNQVAARLYGHRPHEMIGGDGRVNSRGALATSGSRRGPHRRER